MTSRVSGVPHNAAHKSEAAMMTAPSPRTPHARLIQIREAAAILGVSLVTVRRRVRDGSLPHVRIKGRLYFRANELHAFIEAHRGGTSV